MQHAQGKVRDTYDCGDTIVIVTTDRQSAFDRVLASVPFKVSLSCVFILRRPSSEFKRCCFGLVTVGAASYS